MTPLTPPVRRPLTVALAAASLALVAGCGSPEGGEGLGPASRAPESGTTSATAEPPASPATAATHEPAPAPDADLRRELLRRQALDQAVRGGPAPKGLDPATLLIDEVDGDNQAFITGVFDERGWPGWSLAGRDGSTAAWLIVQHADLDPELQQRGLDLLRAAVAADDASRGDLAYLTDRVLVAQGEPQVYGTQWEPQGDGWVPRTPIEDRAEVDRRRAEAGLGTLRSYLRELRAIAP